MLNKERNQQIYRIKKQLELQGYFKTHTRIIESWESLLRGSLCLYSIEDAYLIIEKGKSCEIAMLDTLYYKGVNLNIFKKFRVYIKNKIYFYISRNNYKSLEVNRKDNLRDFLKLIRENKIKDRKIKF